MTQAADIEIVDEAHNVVIRRVVVGPLDTNCWILHGTTSVHALVIDPGTATEQLLACGCSLALPTGTAPWTGSTRTCSPFPLTAPSTPATANRPPSEPNDHTSPGGSGAGGELGVK